MTPLQGLTTQEAQKRLQQHGRNELIRSSKVHPVRILLSQFTSPLILVLIAAALISLAIGLLPGQQSNTVDAVLILVIVLLSGIFGFIQDYEAEKTIEALQKMAVPQSRVIREGREMAISSAEVVPGDLILLEAGDMVTADCRLLQTFHLEVDESVLTGESVTIHKQKEQEAYAHTYVTAGNAKAVVLHTGMSTRIGKVASRLQEMGEEKSSFQKELEELGKTMSLMTLIMALIIGFIGIMKFGFYNSLLTAISLAVAAIPEGLPAVVVLALAVGANIMVKKNALIRKLSIVESVGAVDLICTDKTGTLTKNEMTVVKLFTNGEEQTLSPDTALKMDTNVEMLLKCGMLCNNATTQTGDDQQTVYFGEQTEIALKKISQRLLSRSQYLDYKKVNELSFNSERKMMSVVMEDAQGHYTVFSKGAPEVLIHTCDRILLQGSVEPLSQELRQTVLDENTRLAQSALRVLGFAYKASEKAADGMEEALIWIGLQGMIDPPRQEVRMALEECKTAGIRVIMITGDNPTTAQAIAGQIGLESQGVMTGSQMDQTDDTSLQQQLKNHVNIFARTNPFHKLRILEALETQHNVAMTGDGINDALAIKKANVGIAMGKKGTEVAKQASDIVLLDDNFSTIREAIKQGRTIFNNIRKFINYLLTCNFAEVAVIFLSTLLLTLDEPILLPVQLLWVNLLTDGLVALALGVDPPAHDIMQKKPRRRNERLISKQLGWMIGLIGMVKTLMLLLTFLWVYSYAPQLARSVLFTAFVLYEFVRIATIRQQEKLNWFSNKWLLLALICSLALQLMILYTPLNHFFYADPLGLKEWGILLLGSLVGYGLAVPVTKLIVKWVPEG